MSKETGITPNKDAATSPSPLTRSQPRTVIGSLRSEIDRVFEDFDKAFWGAPFGQLLTERSPGWKSGLAATALPFVDVVEKDDSFEISADLPGMEEKDVDLKLSGDVLTLRAERHHRKEEKKGDYYLSERQFGLFERSFELPASVDAGKIAADFHKGVLTIRLPKKPEAKTTERKIQIGKTG